MPRAVSQCLNTVYALCAQPEEICTALVQAMASNQRLFVAKQPEQLSKRGLSRVLFLVGHAAVKQLVFIEETASRLKKGTDANRVEEAGQPAEAESAKKKGKGKKKQDEDAPPGSPRGLEAELGFSDAIEEGEAEIIREIAEQEILSKKNLLGAFAETVGSICALAYTPGAGAVDCPAAGVDEGVRKVAVLALCKLMTVGSTYCDSNLQLLFTVLQKDKSAGVRANIIIALGDLAFRFPNLLEPWSGHFYAMLADKDLTVRKHTLMALTHLILNDMIKVRAQVSDIALCLEDSAPRMQELARLFFTELSHKGTNNPIYNYLPDIIGRLSHNETVGPDQFQRIMKFLVSFIEKDKQAEGLVEKLCHRFRGTVELSQWRDIAYCLSMLNFSDRCIKKVRPLIMRLSAPNTLCRRRCRAAPPPCSLVFRQGRCVQISELQKCYADKLGDPKVYVSFQTIVAKGRKFAKPETKLLLDEYETKLAEAHAKVGGAVLPCDSFIVHARASSSTTTYSRVRPGIARPGRDGEG